MEMDEGSGGVDIKKLIILIVLTVGLIFILVSQFGPKSGSNSPQRGVGGALADRPLPPNFDQLPQRIQERILERRGMTKPEEQTESEEQTEQEEQTESSEE